jgi:hypothetical protein
LKLSKRTNAPLVLSVRPSDRVVELARLRSPKSSSFADTSVRLPASAEMTMGRERAAGLGAGAEPETRDVHQALTAIEAQGRQTLELVKALVTLLMPKEGGREGPSLEDLLAQMIAQQREAIQIGRATHGELQRLARTLPDAVAEAVEGRIGGARNG